MGSRMVYVYFFLSTSAFLSKKYLKPSTSVVKIIDTHISCTCHPLLDFSPVSSCLLNGRKAAHLFTTFGKTGGVAWSSGLLIEQVQEINGLLLAG
mmetsp:Transcript_4227/g.7762  ORF Transcript_4227/g.7762 Transcript_4227/m.7762 type:complete len:95 (-) Transcript_4227:618-902(-)